MSYLIAPLIIVAARLLWQRRPGALTSTFFWGSAFALVVIIGWQETPSQYLLTAGILSNAAVTLANGGFMPVAMHRRLAGPARSLWVQREAGQHLLFLADNFGNNSIRFSVGDVALFAGIVLSAVGY